MPVTQLFETLASSSTRFARIMFLAAVPLADFGQSVGAVLERVFGGDYPPKDGLLFYQAAARGVVVYFVGLLIVRVGKSRLIARISTIDVILGFILGSLLARGITGSASISGTIAASVAVVGCHSLFTYLAFRSHAFGTLLKGRYLRPLVIDGKFQYENMRRSHLSEHDVMEEVRLKGIGEVSQVAHAYKERNGEVSVIPQKPEPRVVEVAVRDGVQTVRIELS
jgi:uncharacterized membrane protein YcaP (DUF421 family)